MPRDGSGIYTYPPGSPGIPDTTIESAKYNGYIADIQQDLNLPRPIVAGGTGASNATAARDNLDAERSGQQVTNYDTHVWEAGSFWSAGGATSAPVAGHGFAGIAYIYGGDPSYMVIEARDLHDPIAPGTKYMRHRVGGAWDTWYSNVHINNPSSTGAMDILFTRAGKYRWAIKGGENAETGGNAGSDLVIYRFADDGSFIGPTFSVGRGNGVTQLPGPMVFMRMGSSVPTVVNGTIRVTYPGTPTGEQGIILRKGADVDCHALLFEGYYGTHLGNVTVGSATVAFNTTSDERLKEDLKSFDAGNIVDDTNVYDFAWKSTGERSYGIIAQQAQQTYPAAVTHDEKGDNWFLDYSKYVPVIMQELKALRARVAELEGKLEAGAQPA